MAIGRTNQKEFPFPQADDPFKVTGVIKLAATCKQTDDDRIAAEFDVVPRQGAYYGTAAAYLGYIYSIGGYWRLTKKGEAFMSKTATNQASDIGATILSLPAFDYAAEHIAIMGDLPRDKDTASIIEEADDRVNETTAFRRAKTVNSWVEQVWATCPTLIDDIAEQINGA